MTFDLEDAKARGCLYQGYPTRIICTDRVSNCGYSVIALYKPGEAENYLASKPDGLATNGVRLQNLPREVTVWVAANDAGYRYYVLDERDARDWCDRQRNQDRAAGYAPVTIKLTR